MAFNATVRRLLVSSPGDVPQTDLHIVNKAISVWNGSYGEMFGSIVLPVSWGTHAAAEFGRTPQDILNEQIVDRCDICVALFANRMGTPTAVAESGTAEEIKRLNEAGKYVAVLRSRRAVDPGTVSLEQAGRLDDYMSTIRQEALVMEYRDDATLEGHINAILHNAVARDQGRIEVQLEANSAGRGLAAADVWPRIDISERTESDSRGRIRTKRNWYLVLANTGAAPAKNVRYEFPDQDDSDAAWHILSDDDDASEVILAPHGGEVRYPLLAVMGSASQVSCTVRWSDDRGEHENTATLRLV